MNKITKILIGIAILGALGAYALKASCEGCPGGCPIHSGTYLTDCITDIDPQTGKLKSAKCTYSCGCIFTNNGGKPTSGAGKTKVGPEEPSVAPPPKEQTQQ